MLSQTHRLLTKRAAVCLCGLFVLSSVQIEAQTVGCTNRLQFGTRRAVNEATFYYAPTGSWWRGGTVRLG